MRIPVRPLLIAALALGLGACAAPDPLEEDLPDMGSFRLSHNIVVADNMQQVPPSREATAEEWETILSAEIDRRFSGYEGDRLFHIGIAVDGYALAPPGIPVVMAPRSLLALSVNVWDDALGEKLHEEPHQLLVFEGTTGGSALLGSGLVRTREEQMAILARNAAREVQLWMLENPAWFDIDPNAAAAAVADVSATAGDTALDAGEIEGLLEGGEAGTPPDPGAAPAPAAPITPANEPAMIITVPDA